ncbi:DUF4221 family protein [Roseivirga echinicomitans]|uniref:DUF4221 domain-containing protein n=1 Tax=Roseivirga echinicomitans TaxID=296218 RepID=A0A150XYM0_9BACT|nr:DUF4221 family protein [Roseivirga echinicomitans]KYG83801.1 hypothetical protein AWN68_03060 [Roseivirga echinicomitans]
MNKFHKNYFSFFTAVFFALFLVSCNGDKQPATFDIPDADFTVEAIKTGMLKIPLDSMSSNKPVAFQAYNKKGTDYFTFLNHFNNSIYYYNLKTQTYDSIQQFPEQGPNGLGKFDSTIEYEFLGDSIMFYSRSTLQITIVNNKKDVVFKYNFGKEGKTAPYGMTRGWAFRTSTGFNFSSVAQTPYIKLINLPDSLEFDFSLKTLEVKKKHSPLPTAYKGEMWMLEQLRYHRAENEKYRAYSYPIDPYVQIRKPDGSFISKYFGSKIVKPIVPIASIQIAMDMETSGKYYFGQGRYGQIYYDPYRKVFLRAGYSGMNENEIDINNPFGDTTTFDKVFVIGDDELNVKGELKNNRMVESFVFFQKNGIYVLVDTDDEDHLTFDIYDIVER